ncbi:MAG: hypothetical protein E6R04_10205 [Spirochaetes bacterium]|nr:MAG: hypothetical protein E6R04_10205 [Spirochaetota bacterium]
MAYTLIEFVEIVTNNKVIKVCAEGEDYDSCRIYFIQGGLTRTVEILPDQSIQRIYEKVERIFRYGKLYAEKIGATVRYTTKR